jgi:hypothetical protein
VKTLQQIFDIVIVALRAQGCPSYRLPISVSPQKPIAGCLYRGPNGAKCAIGHLIRDEDYKPEFEMKGINADIRTALRKNGVNVFQNFELATAEELRTFEFLKKLQVAHDIFAGMSNEIWRDELEKRFNLIADDFNLIYTPPAA